MEEQLQQIPQDPIEKELDSYAEVKESNINETPNVQETPKEVAKKPKAKTFIVLAVIIILVILAIVLL